MEEKTYNCNYNYKNKYKNSFFVINIKKYILPTLFIIYLLCLILFSGQNILAVENGLKLFVNNIFPSLFPFFIAIELLNYTNIGYVLGKIFNPLMKPLFNVNGTGAYPLIIGLISGYPVGAKITAEYRNKRVFTKEESERLLSFTNNSNPLFIISTVGITMLHNKKVGVILLITHVLGALTVGLLFKFWKKDKEKNNNTNNNYNNINNKNIYKNKEIEISKIGEILSKSITSAIKSTLLIGGFIILFSIIISNLQNIAPLKNSFILNLVELTYGLNQICKTLCFKNIILASFLLGFGGISIMFQIWSVISNTDISIKPYIIGKLLHAIVSSIYTYIILLIYPSLL